jgi:hypothetical protein
MLCVMRILQQCLDPADSAIAVCTPDIAVATIQDVPSAEMEPSA